MDLKEYIKSNNLNLEDLKKAEILTFHGKLPVVFFDEKKSKDAAAKAFYEHFCTILNFESLDSQHIFDVVASYLLDLKKNNKECGYMDRMPYFFSIKEDIGVSFGGDEEEAMEFYSNCDYEVIL